MRMVSIGTVSALCPLRHNEALWLEDSWKCQQSFNVTDWQVAWLHSRDVLSHRHLPLITQKNNKLRRFKRTQQLQVGLWGGEKKGNVGLNSIRHQHDQSLWSLFITHLCLFTATLTKPPRWNCNLHGRGHYNYYNHQWIFNPPVKQERTRVQRENVGFKISLIWTSASRTLLEGLLVSLFIHWSKVRRRRRFSLVDNYSLDCYVDFT